TPAVSFSVVHRKASWGIVITASHNPAFYNGFKIKEGLGRSAPPEVTREIEAHLTTAAARPPASQSPADEFDDRRAYERYLRDRLDWKALRSYKGRVVFDYLFGVAAGIPESVLKDSSLSLYSIHAAVDPLFGGLHPEPSKASWKTL